IIILNCGNKNSDKPGQIATFKNDSVQVWIKFSKNRTLPLDSRRLFLDKAYTSVTSGKTDTSVTRTLCRIAYQYLILKDTSRFRALNNEAYELAVKLKDTFSLADIHWSNANLY